MVSFAEQQQVLHSPFNIETHKRTFINYLEVVILEDRTIEYAVPSHQEKLIRICLNKLDITRDELYEMCPLFEFYFDFNIWLSQMSGAIAVWNDRYEGIANTEQKKILKRLKMHGLYVGTI